MNLFSLSLLPGAYSAIIGKVVPKKPCDPQLVKAAYERISQVARNFMDGKILIKQVNGINVADLGAQWHIDKAFLDECEGEFLGCVEQVVKPVEEVKKFTARVVTQESGLLDPLMRVVNSIGVPATVAIGVGAATLCGWVIYKMCTSKAENI